MGSCVVGKMLAGVPTLVPTHQALEQEVLRQVESASVPASAPALPTNLNQRT